MFSVYILFHHWFPLLEKVEIRAFILPRDFPLPAGRGVHPWFRVLKFISRPFLGENLRPCWLVKSFRRGFKTTGCLKKPCSSDFIQTGPSCYHVWKCEWYCRNTFTFSVCTYNIFTFLFTKMDKIEIIAKLTKMRQHYIHIYNTYMLPLRLFS